MFQKPLKRYFRNVLALIALSYFYPGFVIEGGLTIILAAALLLYLVQLFLHPLLKILYLPFNIITLGMFSWLLVSTHLLIVAFILKDVSFQAFHYAPITYAGIAMEGGDINFIFSVIIGTIFYRFIRKIIFYLTSGE